MKFPLFTDELTRDSVLSSLRLGQVLDPGDTLRHVQAFPLGIWYDFDAVATDAAEIFRSELREFCVTQKYGPDVMKFLETAPIHLSGYFRAELARAIAPRMQQIDLALCPRPGTKLIVYTLPDMDVLYRQVLNDCHQTARVKYRSDFESGVAAVRASEEAVEE